MSPSNLPSQKGQFQTVVVSHQQPDNRGQPQLTKTTRLLRSYKSANISAVVYFRFIGSEAYPGKTGKTKKFREINQEGNPKNHSHHATFDSDADTNSTNGCTVKSLQYVCFLGDPLPHPVRMSCKYPLYRP